MYEGEIAGGQDDVYSFSDSCTERIRYFVASRNVDSSTISTIFSATNREIQ